MSAYSKTLEGGYDCMNWRQVGCMISIMERSTIEGFKWGMSEVSSDMVSGGKELGTL